MKSLKILTVSLILFIVLTAGSAFALEGMVIRMEQGNNIVVNKGLNHQVMPGTVLYVTRINKPVATIKVVQVDDYSSVCSVVELIPNMRIEVGDVISTQPFPKPEEEAKEEESSVPKNDKSADELEKEKRKAKEEYEKNVETNYKDVMKRKTQIYRFRRGSGGTVKINAFDMYNLVSTFAFSGPYASFNIWHGLSSAHGIYSSYKSSANPNRIRNVQIELTHWDSEYLDAFASYYAYKETISDPRRINMVKKNIYRQKGLDKFYVFQVKIVNPGPGAFQLAPFPWHCYLIDSKGTRIKADHYDEILDKALNPQQVVNGYIYFKKVNAQGQPIAAGSGITLELADILGNTKKVNFK